MVSPSLKQFCELVSEEALSNAAGLRETFSNLASSHSLTPDPKYVLKIFAFMNWTFAQGAWSNLQNPQIRRDLQIELKDCLITKLATQFARSDKVEDIAIKAVSITEDFNVYLIGYNQRMQELGCADSNAARLFALERIQDECGIEDGVMNDIVPSIWSDKNANSEVELIAMQVNDAAEIKSKGFLRRLFGGR